MKKYIIKEFKKKDGTIVYTVYEITNSYSKGGLEWNSLEPKFSGTLKECKNKIKELEVK